MLLAVRHTQVTQRGLCYGRSDVPTEPASGHTGRLAEQIDARRRALGLPSAPVETSPARRCVELASKLAAALGTPLLIDARLVELDFGRWEGASWASIEEREPAALFAWMENYHSMSPPGGESLTELSARVRAWYYTHEKGAFPREPRPAWRLCVTHAGVLRALKVLLENITWPEALAWRVPHAEVIDFSEIA